MNQLGGGIGNPVSVGLYRFEGSGQDRDEQVAWSAILKLVQSPANLGWTDMGEGEDQTHWNYWKRELLVYPSGILSALPAGLAAPRCFGAIELPGHVGMLWLEDLRDAYAGVWPLARYVLAARHLGRLNGLYASARPLPAFPWFSRQRTRQWIDSMTHWRTFPWDHPRVLSRYPQPAADSFRRLLAENERFLAQLDRLPQTLGHGDTYPTNLMSRQLADGQEETVALDWALMGIAPIGDDLGQIVMGAQINLPAAAPEEITELLLEGYIAGLQESGCHVDPRWVRFGFTASAALRIGLFRVHLLGEELEQSEVLPEESGAQPVTPNDFELSMADAAYALLETMGG